MKLCFFIILYIFLSIFYVSAEGLKIDNIAAIVNETAILNSDIDQVLFLLKKEGHNIHVPLRADFLKDKAIQKLILDSLMLEEANKMNLIVTKNQVNSVLKNIAFKKNITVDQLKNDILFNMDNHFTYQDYIDNIKKTLKIKMIEDYELRKRIYISDQEVNFFFRKIINSKKTAKNVKFSYILLPFPKEKSANIIYNKKVLAENIINKLKNGYNFENLYRECKANSSFFSVKNMSWTPLLDVQKTFLNTFIFRKGQVLGPFLKDKGFYILKINDIKDDREKIITEFHIQHFLIKPSEVLTSLEAKKNIFNIHKNIVNKIYSFDYAIKHFSHDFYSYRKKGDLGWISNEEFPFKFNKVLLSLKKNEISKPIKSNFGWHIIKLLDKRKINKYYKIEKDKVYHFLLNRKVILERKNWIKDLKRFAYIKIIR